MKRSRAKIGTVITVEITDNSAREEAIEKIFSYFEDIEKRFSIFDPQSEISLINNGMLKEEEWSPEMIEIFALAEKTRMESNGYFNILTPAGNYNPSGIVKGWAILNASKMLLSMGFKNFYVDAGGDIQIHGKNKSGVPWSVGIKNPFNQEQIVKVIYPGNRGIATSGTYIRGQHIYNPLDMETAITEIVSLTVIGPDVCEADRFATAAFAMGKKGIYFIEETDGLEGYLIDDKGIGTSTSGFAKYTEYKS
jgi:thiamine biosynthesis lipoprotein